MKARKEFRKGDRVFTFANSNGVVRKVWRTGGSEWEVVVDFDNGKLAGYNADGTKGKSKHQVLFHGYVEDALSLLEQLQPTSREYWLIIVRAFDGSFVVERWDTEAATRARAQILRNGSGQVLEVLGPYYEER